MGKSVARCLMSYLLPPSSGVYEIWSRLLHAMKMCPRDYYIDRNAYTREYEEFHSAAGMHDPARAVSAVTFRQEKKKKTMKGFFRSSLASVYPTRFIDMSNFFRFFSSWLSWTFSRVDLPFLIPLLHQPEQTFCSSRA